MEREIRLQETRNLDGLDRDIPTILAGGTLYVPHLERFFLNFR